MIEKRTIPEHAQLVFEGKLFDVYQWEQELFDGSTATFEGIDRVDSVRTFGVLPSGDILMAFDEQPHRTPQLQAPGGLVDPGETPADAAQREFLEETGYTVGKLTPWRHFHPHTNTNWKVHAFIGRQLTKVAEQQPEPGERITLKTYSFDEFLQLGHEPLVHDALLRVLLLEALLDETKKEDLRKLLLGEGRVR